MHGLLRPLVTSPVVGWDVQVVGEKENGDQPHGEKH